MYLAHSLFNTEQFVENVVFQASHYSFGAASKFLVRRQPCHKVISLV